MKYLKLIGKFIIYAVVLIIIIAGVTLLMGISLGIDIYLLYISILAVLYFPILFIKDAWPRETKKGYDDPEIIKDNDVKVANDIAHFKDIVNKAINGSPIAQRDVEMRLLNMVDIDLKIRFGLSNKELTANMENGKFLKKYMGSAGEVVARIYRRRHDLTNPVPGDKFKKEIEAILEAIR